MYGVLTEKLVTSSGNKIKSRRNFSVLLFCDKCSNILLLTYGHQQGVIFILYIVGVALYLDLEGDLLELESKYKLHSVSY